MALVPDSPEQKKQAHLDRMTAWLNKKTPEERKKYCDHGNSAVLAKLVLPLGCEYCKEKK